MARCAAKYFVDEDLPLRLSYVGNTFSNTSLLQGKLKETTQMGAELMGDDSVEADGEMIAMLIDALLKTGLKQFQVSVGEIDYFKGICEDLSLSGEQENVIRDYISNKNFFAVKEYLQSEKIADEKIDAIMMIEDLFGSVDMLEEAEKLSNHCLVQGAIERLKALYEVLCAYGVEKYVSFDLGIAHTLVKHKENGFLAEYKNIESLKNGLNFIYGLSLTEKKNIQNELKKIMSKYKNQSQWYEVIYDNYKKGLK